MKRHTLETWDDDWDFPAGEIVHQVFRKGDASHPGVVLMHELPGMTPECLRLAEEIVAAGFRVYLPLFFGAPRETATARNLVRICIRREFHLLRKGSSGPITDWLRQLCDEVYRQCGGRGVGAIGMCLTGGFALALMIKPTAVNAPVLSQPSIPFAVPWVPGSGRALGVPRQAFRDTREWAEAQKSERPDFVIPAFRFAEDRLCARKRFDSLRDQVGREFFVPDEGGEGGLLSTISAERRRAAGIPIGETHSVLTGYGGNGGDSDPTVTARRQVIRYLREQLSAT